MNLQNPIPNLYINDQEISPLKLINYPKIIEDLASEMKKASNGLEKEWKLVEDNKNFSILLKFDRNNHLWSKAEAEIMAPEEKVTFF